MADIEERVEVDKDETIDHLTKQLDYYKTELSVSQAHEQRASRELITYLILERDAIRTALEQTHQH